MVKRDPFIELSEVEAREVRWLFRPFIPFSMITILEGDPGLGKSFLAMHIAAAVSRGGLLPNEQRVDRGKVVYLAAEDDAAYTTRPTAPSCAARSTLNVPLIFTSCEGIGSSIDRGTEGIAAW